MTDAQIKAVLRAAYHRLERMALATGTASPQTREAILRTLRELRSRLDTDQQYLDEILRESRLQLSGSDG
jgi:hypothetical protein